VNEIDRTNERPSNASREDRQLVANTSADDPELDEAIALSL